MKVYKEENIKRGVFTIKKSGRPMPDDLIR